MAKGLKDKETERVFLLGIFVLSYVLRYVYFLQMKSNPSFFFPTMDSLFYDVWAQSIANGNWIGGEVFFQSPFYAYFLAIIYKVFGHNYVIPRLLQHLIGSFSCVLVYLLARSLFNRKVAVVSALIAAGYGMLLYFENQLLSDSLLVFFDLLLILLLLKAREMPKLSWWFACGLVLGISAITRPNILVFIPFVWLWIYLVLKDKKPLKRIAVFGLLFLLGSVVVISPVTLRNAIVGEEPVLIASQGGINFYIGNNEKADGASAIFGNEYREYKDFQLAAQRETGKALSHSEISGFYYRKGLDFMLQHPLQAFKLLVKKLYLFWNKFEISSNQDIYFARRYSWLIRLLPFGFWLVGPLALSGMILSVLAKRRSNKAGQRRITEWRKKISLPILFVFAYMVTVVVFFVPARFRLPVIPFLIVFSGFSLVWLYDRLRRKEFSSLKLFILIVVPFAVLTNTNAYHYRVGGLSLAQAHFKLGKTYLRMGEPDLAISQFDSTIAINPGWHGAHLNKGMAYFRKGEFEQAEKEFLAELDLNPQEGKAYNHLSALYLRQERYDEAEKMARKAVELEGHLENPYMNLALTFVRTGRQEKAKDILIKGSLEVEPFLEGKLLLGQIYQTETRYDSALQVFRGVIRRAIPHAEAVYDLQTLVSRSGEDLDAELWDIRARAHFGLGAIFMETGELESAERHLMDAMTWNPNLPEAYASLGMLYTETNLAPEAVDMLKQAIRRDPRRAIFHYHLGMAHLKLSQPDEAKEAFETSLMLDSSLTEAREKLLLLESLDK
jgi:4-amino-4-deoxy-L-arabinose transferase-like glycosyltransferase/lipoprotein NlpI